MKANKKKILKYHYGSHISSALAIIVPIFGVITFLSCIDIFPRFPMTENMSGVTGTIIFIVSILISIFCYKSLQKNIKKIDSIIANGEKTTAIITKALRSKRAHTINYKFEFQGEEYEHSTILTKRLWIRKDYQEGNEITIYVMENNEKNEDDDDNVISTLEIFI